MSIDKKATVCFKTDGGFFIIVLCLLDLDIHCE